MDIIGRSAWGAQHAAGFGARAIPLDEAWLHHTVTLAPDLAFTDLNADSVDDDEAKAMRTIERIGQSRFGGGFSYNLAVMPSGRVYVGCGVRRVGAHTSKRNTRSLGVCLVGNYHANPMPEPMLDSLVELLQLAKAEGWLRRPAFSGGHRDVVGTSCPGDYAYAQLPTINARAAGQPVTSPSKPAPTPAPAPAPVHTVEVSMAQLPLVRPGDGMPPKAPSQAVRNVQGLLIAHKHDLSQEGGVDGMYGPGLERELRAFQKARGLAADGIVGANTWDRLVRP